MNIFLVLAITAFALAICCLVILIVKLCKTKKIGAAVSGASMFLTIIFLCIGFVCTNLAIYCPNCQKPCFQKYCTTCGWQVGTKTLEPTTTCPNCGEKAKEDWQFCGACGTILSPMIIENNPKENT